MADFLRPEIVVILKEYEQIAQIQRNNDSVVFKDIFNGNALKTENFTVEDFYQAMAWAGLVRTHLWRGFAKDNHDKIQTYLAIVSVMTNKNIPFPNTGFPYEVDHNYDLEDFDYPITPNTKLC